MFWRLSLVYCLLTNFKFRSRFSPKVIVDLSKNGTYASSLKKFRRLMIKSYFSYGNDETLMFIYRIICTYINLIFYGIPETTVTDQLENCEKLVKDLIVSKLNLDTSHMKFVTL